MKGVRGKRNIFSAAAFCGAATLAHGRHISGFLLMASKSSRKREQARNKRSVALSLNQKQIDKQNAIHQNRELLLMSEHSALIDEMREAGFAPPKGFPTQKQFLRYAAFRKARAAARASSLAEDELAVAQAEGGLLSRIYTRLDKPGLKDTAFANLATLVQRSVIAASSRLDVDEAVVELELPEDDRINSLLKRLSGAA
ncbi:hypothetical protein G6162_001508 [Salmonella enterica]|nr:hypothetical protein [Salmonella enterica subsp. arizonae serovar 53:z4,z23,z32:-]EHJ9658185.1 hypothetical protein [Salmonella enterica]EHK4225429.1 hypothetical protein [Salmonella enterica]EIF7588010.1 hypothetical protein [Salmonella enterica]EIS8735858.1 hypothetical protein [Salmonella enterica]